MARSSCYRAYKVVEHFCLSDMAGPPGMLTWHVGTAGGDGRHTPLMACVGPTSESQICAALTVTAHSSSLHCLPPELVAAIRRRAAAAQPSSPAVQGSSSPYAVAMPSWDDGDSSSPDALSDLVAMDYAPDTTEDPLFNGVAVGCTEVCRVHNLPPQRCVAFEGSNTGRRFYMCQIENQVMNCGFQSWIDHEEWPETLHRALSKLWAMYHFEHRGRIDDRYQSAVELKQVSDEKQKIEQKYHSLMDDVKKFMDETERKVLEKNYERFKEERKEERKEGRKEGRKEVVVDGKVVEETAALKNQVEVLKNAVSQLKNIIKTQADVMKAKTQKIAAEKEGLKAENEAMKAENEALMAEKDTLKTEKKKVEYMLVDLLNAKNSLSEKVKKIKALCDDQ